MRSLLTRRVFRQILHNELYPEARPVVHCCKRRRTPRNVPRIATRSLFGFSRDTPQPTKPIQVDPGFGTLSQLSSRLAVGERTPPAEVVLQAFNTYFQYRHSVGAPIQENKVKTAMEAFLYLQKTSGDIEGLGLSDDDLRRALKVLSFMRIDQEKKVHAQFATLLYEELERRRLASPEHQQKTDSAAGNGSILAKNMQPYIRCLSLSGNPMQARILLEQFFESDLRLFQSEPWSRVIVGFLWQNQEDEVVKTINKMESLGIPLDPIMQEVIVRHHAGRDDLDLTKKWYNTISRTMPTLETYEAVLNLCIQKHDYEWGDILFKRLFELRVLPRKAWSIIFRWSAAKGKGVDEIDRMMSVMCQRTESLPQKNRVIPDIGMINDLIKLAMSKKEPYTAERYVALGRKWNLEPDARTHLLQLEYRLNVGDLDGARAAYARLRAEDTSDDKDVHLVNKLIVALCKKQQPYNTIMSIVEDLTERNATFEALTVAALCQLHLRRNELDQIHNLLSTYLHGYTVPEQESIRDVFIDRIFDRKTPKLQAWDAYTILSPKFADTPVSFRTRIMSEFFSRGCTDMGVHVFGHMRQQLNRSFRPTADTYAECFQGIAYAGGEIETLHLVHNMLKVDTEIEPTTRLNNSLMLAYIAAGNAGRALEFWNDIAHSREGPTYSSIVIALRACESAPFGERQARDIWARLKRFEIQVTREIYAAYIGAIGGQGAFQECIQLIANAEADAGFKSDALMVGTFYNTAPGMYNKDQVERWAKEAYPEVWQELLALGKTVEFKGDALEDAGLEGEIEDEDLVFNRVSLFNIDRSVKA